MNSKVFSAAKAVRVYKGKTKQEVWDQLMKMFSISDHENLKVRTFIYGGFPLEIKVKSLSGRDTIVTGDIYKTVSNYGNPIYLRITAWYPPHSFSYEEEVRSRKNPTEPAIANTTDFQLVEQPEGIAVHIVRKEREKVNTSFLSYIFRRRNTAGWAAGRLMHIIGGNFLEFKKDNESMSTGEYLVTRDDALRNEI